MNRDLIEKPAPPAAPHRTMVYDGMGPGDCHYEDAPPAEPPICSQCRQPSTHPHTCHKPQQAEPGEFEMGMVRKFVTDARGHNATKFTLQLGNMLDKACARIDRLETELRDSVKNTALADAETDKLRGELAELQKDKDCWRDSALINRKDLAHCKKENRSRQYDLNAANATIAELQAALENIRTLYNRDMMNFCKNKPPELYSGFNACLSCNMRDTCRAIYPKT